MKKAFLIAAGALALAMTPNAASATTNISNNTVECKIVNAGSAAFCNTQQSNVGIAKTKQTVVVYGPESESEFFVTAPGTNNVQVPVFSIDFEDGVMTLRGLSTRAFRDTIVSFTNLTNPWLAPTNLTGLFAGQGALTLTPTGALQLSLTGRTVAAGSVATANVSAVPEPGTWMLMILGLGAVGFAMRRRQTVSTRLQFA